jgi:hypothetical protein
MKFTIENLERLRLSHMEEFTEAHRDVKLVIEGRAAAYGVIEAALKAQHHRRA